MWVSRGVGAWLCALLLAVTGCAGGLARQNAELFPPPARDAVTFWGHACCYIDLAGVGIVTDPVFEKGLIYRHRSIDAPPASAYSGTRVILLSHAHPDHLSPVTLRTFPETATILCPVPSQKYLKDVKHTVRAMRPGDVFEFEGGRIIAVAAMHMGTRWGISAAADGRALGYIIETPQVSVYYSGDTNFFSGFGDAGWAFEPDVLLLNVNGHLHSTDAARAAWASRARVVIPIHWGAYPYWIVGGNGRPRTEDRLQTLIGPRLHVLDPGTSFDLNSVPRDLPALP